MAETSNIAALAEQISNEIFTWFKWRSRPSRDSNWKCVLEHHDKETHPSDVVFHYEDPYTGKILYLNTDLKSYKASSITKTALENALESLSLSVECANISEDWQQKFLLDHAGSSEVMGLLFVYNHDNSFDRLKFDSLLGKIKLSQLGIKERNKIVVFGPGKILDLYNIVHDLKVLIAEDMMTRHRDYAFFNPDLVMSKAHGDQWSHAASVEVLVGPWIIIKHKKISDQVKEGYLIYYMRNGSQVDEFVYFLDALSRFQMLLGDELIRIRLVNAVVEAANNFNVAKDKFLVTWGKDEQRAKRLNEISINSIPTRQTSFNLIEIGMREDE
ncbi:MAG: hypothetical protein AUK48_12370 [Oscillatoriales cyanobacterium CG2_30_44_21]|nr:MAG: hypothetical protein AUK48_12370 [Oscillatoriales cyanobacterium CG2_30_44_21]